MGRRAQCFPWLPVLEACLPAKKKKNVHDLNLHWLPTGGALPSMLALLATLEKQPLRHAIMTN